MSWIPCAVGDGDEGAGVGEAFSFLQAKRRTGTSRMKKIRAVMSVMMFECFL